MPRIALLAGLAAVLLSGSARAWHEPPPPPCRKLQCMVAPVGPNKLVDPGKSGPQTVTPTIPIPPPMTSAAAPQKF